MEWGEIAAESDFPCSKLLVNNEKGRHLAHVELGKIIVVNRDLHGNGTDSSSLNNPICICFVYLYLKKYRK